MDVLFPRPSAPLIILVRSLRWVFGLLLAAWLLLLLAWGALHWLIVPRIDELRPTLEARLSHALGVTVRVGAIEARTDSLIPSFELRDVRLIDPQGREALALPRVLAALSPRSLWNLNFEQLYVEAPRLAVRRAVDGRIFVAGLDVSRPSEEDGRAADWFFAQTEFIIRGGSVEWIDELRGTPALRLEQVDFIARNRAWTHALRLDATPPPEWGERFTLMARMRQPLLSTHSGRWRDWDGQLYADFGRLDVSHWHPYLAPWPGLRLEHGTGAVRAWADIRRGEVEGGTVDVLLAGAAATLGEPGERLVLPQLSGRISGRRLSGGFEAWTEALHFETEDGLRWPGGNLRLLQQAAEGKMPARGELQGDRLDLQALARVAQRLPLAPAIDEALRDYAPRGTVERIQASWQGELAAPTHYEVKGRVAQVGLAARARPVAGQPSQLVSPGVRGLSADFELTPAGGRANVSLQAGHIELPGWFEDPVLMLDQLSSEVRWQVEGRRIGVQMPNLRFSHADAQGELDLKWHTGEDETTRFPGVLDLQGSMSRAAGHRVYRYLPLDVPQEVREYLRAAVAQAPASAVRYRVKGDLQHFPFARAGQGEFRVSAHLRDASFTYLPRSLQAANEPPWPALTQLSGELLIDRTSLALQKVTARVAGANALRITRAEAAIPDFLHAATVSVQGEARGPLTDMLSTVVRGSPLAAMTGHVLDQASGTGAAELQLQLSLPLTALEKSTVQGKVILAGNDVQLMPTLPRLQRARGVVHFSEKGFAISGGQARLLGGEMRAEGGSIPVPGPAGRGAGPPLLRISGNLTAEGLRQTRELGVLARLAQQAGGSTGYTATLGWRRGAPELLLTSSLQGLSLNLPAPLHKSVEAVLPLRLEVRPQAGPVSEAAAQDEVLLELGRTVSARYVRDLTQTEARVLRGAIGIGLAADEAAPMPTEGVAANIRVDRLDLDAWRVLLPETGSRGEAMLSAYAPSLLALRASELVLDGRRINQIVAGGSRAGDTWRVNLDARELSGYAEYQPSVGAAIGRVYARLARLVLAPTATAEVEKLLDVQPENVPALDVVVGDLELRGKKLGRVEIEAVNRGAREWRLNKLNVILPEARLSAVGQWAPPVDLGSSTDRASGRRRTLMDFRLEVSDAGELLARLGMKDVIRKGQGKLDGQVVWQGSPLAIDYPSLSGAVALSVENGQFLKADPGIAKLLGVLSLQALPRRLMLDFRDVFSEGFAFDFVRGDARIQQGVLSTNNLQMKGVNAAVLMEGRVDLVRETQNLKVVVVPEIGPGTTSLITAWINPVIGLTSFLAQLILRQPLVESVTQEFRVDGSWTDPRVTRTDTASPAGSGSKR